LTPEEGTFNQLWAAFGNKRGIESEKAYELIGKLMRSGKISSDEGLAKKLWDRTEEALEGWRAWRLLRLGLLHSPDRLKQTITAYY
jgi:hypothetical protein